jgi:hypothetical protein
MSPFFTGARLWGSRGLPTPSRICPGPLSVLRSACSDEAVREDAGVRDGGAGEGGLNDRVGSVRARADVHHHVIDLVVRVQVVIEEEVTGFECVEGDMGEGGPLHFGRSRDGDAGLLPGPLHQP